MEDGEGLNSSSEKSDLPWFADLADGLCSYYLSIGVPYHEYWHGDHTQLRHYDEAHLMNRRHENSLLWLQGRYIYEAIGALAPILHAFAKEGTQAKPYLSEPYPIDAEEAEARQERERIEKYNRLKNYVSQWADTQNQKSH